MEEDAWLRFIVAGLIGLLVGVERERSKGEGPTRREAGVRTFALASLLGAVASHLGGPLLLAVALGAVGALAAIAYLRRRGDDPGLTTEVSLILTVLLGALSLSDAALAAGLGVALAIALAAKAPVHSFVRNVLTQSELRDGFILAAATLIVWPALPDRALGPYGALNPYKIWALVILVLAIGAAGHIAVRALGGRYGLPLSGFGSGFVSSVATVGAMGQRARETPGLLQGAVAGAALSNVATFIQMGLLLTVISPPTARLMTPSLLAGGVVAAAHGLWFAWLAAKGPTAEPPREGAAFSLRTAFLLAATLALMLVAAAFLRDWLGQPGVVAGAALAGFADTHAAAISVASLVANGKLAAGHAVIPVLAAMSCNAVTKTAMAFGAGAAGFGVRFTFGLALAMGAAWLAAAIDPAF